MIVKLPRSRIDGDPQKKRFKRRAIFTGWLFAILSTLWVAPVLAQDQTLLHRRPILAQALVDYRSGRPNLARQRLQYLLRSSPDAADEAYLLSLLDRIGRESAWLFRGGGSVLPSSNIDKVSAHRFFDTQLGQLQIPGGGEPHFGTGFSLWGEAGRSWVTKPGRDLSLVLGLGRFIQPEPSESHNDLRLTLAYQAYSRRGHWRVAISGQATRQDGVPPGGSKVDGNQLSLSLSGAAYLEPNSILSGDISIHSSDFLYRNHLDGPSVTVRLGISRTLGDRTNFVAEARFGRSLPQANHLAKTSANLTFNLNRQLGDNFSLGGMVELGRSHFDGIFPTLSHPRRDSDLALGLTLSDNRIQIFGKVPVLNCTWRSALSNVALYEYQSTDCQVSMTIDF